MFTKGDFHLHTNASDGRLSPSQLIKMAKEKNLDIMSITDHDTISSIEESVLLGKALGITVIPGIELSTVHKGESIHLLGYFKDDSYKKNNFSEELKVMIDYRRTRAEKIIYNLEKYFDIKLNYDEVIKSAKGVLARPHIAKAIIEAGYDFSWDYIFHNIISEDSPAYIPKKNLSIEEGINLLKSVNALVVLAHPVLMKKNSIEDLMCYNLDGIEAIYHSNTEEQCNYFKSIAKKYNKFITAGSDFHGIGEGDNGHGIIGCVSLNAELIEIFLEKLHG